MRAAMFLSLFVLATACVEDSTMGITVAPVQLPMGESTALDVSGTLPPVDTIQFDADDPDIASLAYDGRQFVVTAHAMGDTTLHLTFRGGALHVPTTVMPPAISQ
jgi:hypothetical protein